MYRSRDLSRVHSSGNCGGLRLGSKLQKSPVGPRLYHRQGEGGEVRHACCYTWRTFLARPHFPYDLAHDLTMEDEIQALALFILLDAQTHDEIHNLENDKGDDGAVYDRDADTVELQKHLAAVAFEKA